MSLSPLFRPITPLLFTLAPAMAQAQAAPPVTLWIPPQQALQGPAQPVRLERVAIDIRTEGFLARTRIELEFHNPNARVLEGEFIFPLAPGQSLSGYELEVEGAMRAGVVVPKQTARVAYEDTVRQQIDPGLAELTRGNVFRTRLYPIPANGSKRIALSFEQAMADGGDHYRYLLPLSFGAPVREFTVDAQAMHAGAAPLDASPDASLRFDRAGAGWNARLRRENVQPQRELAFRIPKAEGERPVLEAADARDPAWRSVVAALDSGRQQQAAAPVATRHVALWIDASGSARARDRARENAVLRRWIEALGEVEVELVAFRDAADAPRRFSLRGDAGALFDAIDALPLDGGSQWGVIDPALTPKAQLIVVVGDGLSNFGEAEPKLAGGDGVPVHVLHAAQQVDAARLSRIARRGGGQVIDLLRLDADAALAALQARPWRLLRASADGGECIDLVPRVGAAVDDLTAVAARCRGRGTLRLEFGDGRQQVQREIAFGAADPVNLALEPAVHRIWAAAHLAELESESAPGDDRSARIALATRYGVVTADTSLLVLDRVEDYVRYRIEPPEPALRERYQALLAAQTKEPSVDAGRAARIEELRRQWREFREWHETPHAWLETLLVPTAGQEVQRWTAIGSKDAASAARAQELYRQAEALATRWRSEGADDTRRAAWEHDATRVMLELDALRRERLAKHPESEQSGEAARNQMPAPMPASEPMPTPPGESMTADVAPPPPVGAAPPPAAAVARKASAAGATPSLPQARIELSAWNPDTPYLAAIRDADDAYGAYLAQREQHATSPAFYLDVADHFRDVRKDPRLARRILSNLAEIGFDDTALVRVLGYRLMQWGETALARGQFEDALRQRPEEPQSYRDLALALARLPQPELARAVELLWQVATGDWHGRFPGIESIALHELLDLLANAPDPAAAKLDALDIPDDLLQPLAVGLRVVLTWDADNTDIDLWVTDPTGKRVYYGDPRSESGGHVSRDFTQGYGPEVYTIRRPLPGIYRVQAHYYGDRRQSLTGPVTVQLEFQTRFGTTGGERTAVTRRLETGKRQIDIGSFTVQ